MDIEKMLVEVLMEVGKLQASVEDLKMRITDIEESNNSRSYYEPREFTPPKKDAFEAALNNLLTKARSEGKRSLIISAGELHRVVGGYPGANHRMPTCVGVMHSFLGKGAGGKIINSPLKGKGASLEIEYYIGDDE